MNDLISRQEAIDALESKTYRHTYLDQIVGIIKDLPSAKQWIPCEERLPEPNVAVLGYAPKWNNVFALSYDSVYGWMVWSPISDDCFPNMYGDIVAWMPMPEYEEET